MLSHGAAAANIDLVFLGTLMSVFITPVVMLIVLLVTGPPRGIEWHRRPQSD
jgi:predicted Na+-dependent transporter